ncbi:MAG: DNA mismatch repair protein MutS [Nitrospira sp.]|nr:DNA mismatch repair protein MutS [Nitrospira sp.]
MAQTELKPLLKQYWDIKRHYADAIVFFRVGDFYEMFYEDAKEAATLLNIALTTRDKNSPNPVPLCGVPYHAATSYLAKLLKAGKTVALCEQVEDPKAAKGLVKREVVRLYTPGTIFDDELLDAKAANFLAALSVQLDPADSRCGFGLASIDLSTGQFLIAEFTEQDLMLDELIRLGPQEVLIPEQTDTIALDKLLAPLRLPRVTPQPSAHFELHASQEFLQVHFGVDRPDVLGLSPEGPGVQAGGCILRYLKQTQPTLEHHHIQKPELLEPTREMHLDAMTMRNLELVQTLNPDQEHATLLSILDQTVTAMGSRLLRQWVVRPLIDNESIQRRLNAVSTFLDNLKLRLHVRSFLKDLHDLERLSSRIVIGTATPRDVLRLKESLTILPKLVQLFDGIADPLLNSLLQRWDVLSDVTALIEDSIDPNAPASVKEGPIFQNGVDPVIDELRTMSRNGVQWLTDLEQREREQSGIDSLKIKYNQVFGYYFEVTKANLSRVPEYFRRKQTLVNAERYTTQDLEGIEAQLSGANEKLRRAEQERFQTMLQTLSGHVFRIQKMAKHVALMDVLSNFAEVAARNRYVKPDMHDGGIICIKNGRHPVVEQFDLPEGFIPNDSYLDFDAHRLLLLTGPNMAGKSTFLRQTGLIVLMAHMGCFVPASEAKIGVIDRLFTRVGASDNLALGLSTFMVEMLETAKILRGATSRSLILLDEIGRGTSTYDGLSLAWAIAEHIQDRRILGARTLFATHYHEMTELETFREGVQNLTVAVKEEKDDVIFLRKITQGKATRSYGIHVGKLAGLPSTLIARAQEVLAQLEQETASESRSNRIYQQGLEHEGSFSPQPHPLIEEIKQLELFAMTPLEALNRLAEIQKRLDAE